MRFKSFISVVLPAALSLSLPLSTYAAPGDLDPSFGTDGKVITTVGSRAVGSRADEIHTLAIQADGKIVVGGHGTSLLMCPGCGGNTFLLARYNSDGTLDTGFGDNGTTGAFVAGDAHITAIAVQADQKIVAAGVEMPSPGAPSGATGFALVRFNSNGSIDESFGTQGTVITDISPGDYAVLLAVRIQSDGKIVAAGSAMTSDNLDDFAVIRYNIDGSLDTAFGNGGIVLVDFNGSTDIANDLSIQSDGKIVLAGTTLDSSIYGQDFALVRLNTDGSLDTSFGTNGKVTTDLAGRDDVANSLVIQEDGKIVVGGSAIATIPCPPGLACAVLAASDFALVRYNNDGSLDTTFGTNGKVITDFDSTNNTAVGVSTQSNGKIVVAGNTNGQGALARYNTNGSLDSSFGDGGKLETSYGTGSIYDGGGVAIQADGKIVTAGGHIVDTCPQCVGPGLLGPLTFALARYLGDPVGSNTNDSGGVFGCGATLSNPSKGGMNQGLDLLAEMGLLYLWVTFRKMRHERRKSAHLFS
jgi:uncharacterized delta-60 repeat protein